MEDCCALFVVSFLCFNLLIFSFITFISIFFMQTIQFDKMQGAGNDYVYVDARIHPIEDPQSLAVKISDRHFGVGSDGLVMIMNSRIADFRMRMFNADGSESGMCGNASRCVGKYLYDKAITSSKKISLETGSGIKVLHLQVEGGKVKRVSVDMDMPHFSNKEIPVDYHDSGKVPVEGYEFTCVSMGNPHAVTFIGDTASFDVEGVGRKVENNKLFPERTNVEFAQIISRDRIRMRVWERGSGETLACGTGACATLVAAVVRGLADRKAVIELLGGEVEVEWIESTNRVVLTGGAEWVFSGTYIL
jgi:diaminopimelate epimerase